MVFSIIPESGQLSIARPSVDHRWSTVGRGPLDRLGHITKSMVQNPEQLKNVDRESALLMIQSSLAAVSRYENEVGSSDDVSALRGDLQQLASKLRETAAVFGNRLGEISEDCEALGRDISDVKQAVAEYTAALGRISSYRDIRKVRLLEKTVENLLRREEEVVLDERDYFRELAQDLNENDNAGLRPMQKLSSEGIQEINSYAEGYLSKLVDQSSATIQALIQKVPLDAQGPLREHLLRVIAFQLEGEEFLDGFAAIRMEVDEARAKAAQVDESRVELLRQQKALRADVEQLIDFFDERSTSVTTPSNAGQLAEYKTRLEEIAHICERPFASTDEGFQVLGAVGRDVEVIKRTLEELVSVWSRDFAAARTGRSELLSSTFVREATRTNDFIKANLQQIVARTLLSGETARASMEVDHQVIRLKCRWRGGEPQIVVKVPYPEGAVKFVQKVAKIGPSQVEYLVQAKERLHVRRSSAEQAGMGAEHEYQIVKYLMDRRVPYIISMVKYRDRFGPKTSLLMPLCDLGNAQVMIRETGRWPLAEDEYRKRMDLVSEVAQGLAGAHAAGVVHLDIKPDNILFITGEDGLPHTRIGDWGASRHLTDGRQLGIQGTYCAPEQLNDGGWDLSSALDLWSFGIFLAEFMFGSEINPFHQLVRDSSFRAAPPDEQRRRVLEARALLLERLKDFRMVGDGTHPLVDCIDTLLSEDPKNRPSADEVFYRLRAAQKLPLPVRAAR